MNSLESCGLQLLINYISGGRINNKKNGRQSYSLSFLCCLYDHHSPGGTDGAGGPGGPGSPGGPRGPSSPGCPGMETPGKPGSPFCPLSPGKPGGPGGPTVVTPTIGRI